MDKNKERLLRIIAAFLFIYGRRTIEIKMEKIRKDLNELNLTDEERTYVLDIVKKN